MTVPHMMNPMPHAVDIRCPECGSCALFAFAEPVRILQKKDIPFFEQSKAFEYLRVKDENGRTDHWALYYPKRGVKIPDEVPEGYRSSDWKILEELYPEHLFDLGTLVCTSCGVNRKHELNWPDEAYYAITYRNEKLWAFHRESALELKDFISSELRDENKYTWSAFLKNVPSVFQAKNAREDIVKKLDSIL